MNCTTSLPQRLEINLQFTNILEANRMYGFQVKIMNPRTFDNAQRQIISTIDPNTLKTISRGGWRIYTGDHEGNLVDGTANTVPFVPEDPGTVESWGLYLDTAVAKNFTDVTGKNGFNYEFQVGVQVDDMTPYAMRPEPTLKERRTYVKVIFAGYGVANSGNIRFIAPPGYNWNFAAASDGFIYQMFQDPMIPSVVTASWPPGEPIFPLGVHPSTNLRKQEVLYWNAGSKFEPARVRGAGE
jgi:hypothetical protein